MADVRKPRGRRKPTGKKLDNVEVEETVSVESPEELVESPVVETPEVEPLSEVVVEPVKKDVVLTTIDDVAAFLKKPGITTIDKLDTLVTDGPITIKSLVTPLLRFKEETGKNAPLQTGKVVVAKIYNLYNTLKSAVETPDANEFKVKMDIINLIFKEFSAEEFSQVKLLRYDDVWSYGGTSLKTYQVLVVAVATLADKSTRASKLKTVNLNSNFVRNNSTISQEHIERLMRYYSA